MAKKSKYAEKTRIATIVDYGILEDYDHEIVAETFRDLKKQYNVEKFAIIYDPQHEPSETVKELSKTVSKKISQDVPVIAYPAGGLLSPTDLKNITFNANRTHFSYRERTLVQLNPFDSGVYEEQFTEAGFDVCVSNTIDKVVENMVEHVVGLKNQKFATPFVG